MKFLPSNVTSAVAIQVKLSSTNCINTSIAFNSQQDDMSLLADEVNIAHDARRIGGQAIEGDDQWRSSGLAPGKERVPIRENDQINGVVKRKREKDDGDVKEKESDSGEEESMESGEEEAEEISDAPKRKRVCPAISPSSSQSSNGSCSASTSSTSSDPNVIHIPSTSFTLSKVTPHFLRPSNINHLPSEVLQSIIARFLKANNWRKLVPLRLVCKHWRNNIDGYLASRHGFQYSGVVKKNAPPPGMNYYEFNAMLSFYPNMRQLIVKNFTVTDHLIAVLRQNCPKLERLSLYGCKGLTWKGMTILTMRFAKLTFLDVSHCDLDENRFDIVCEGLKKLKVLNAINPGRLVTGLALGKLGPEIEDIWIGLNHLADPNPALESLISGNGKNLIHFGLVVMNFQNTNWHLITDNMLKLKSLKLTFGSYGFGSLKNFGKLKELEFIVLAEDSRDETQSVLTDENVVAVVKGCRALKSIAIAGTKPNTCRFSDWTMSMIATYCLKVEQIRLLSAHNVTDEGLRELGRCKILRVLHLSSMSKVTNQGIIDVVSGTKTTIRNFRISDCPQITEAVIDSFITVAKARPDEKIKLYLEGIEVTRSLEGLPRNLKLDIKKESSPGLSTPKFVQGQQAAAANANQNVGVQVGNLNANIGNAAPAGANANNNQVAVAPLVFHNNNNQPLQFLNPQQIEALRAAGVPIGVQGQFDPQGGLGQPRIVVVSAAQVVQHVGGNAVNLGNGQFLMARAEGVNNVNAYPVASGSARALRGRQAGEINQQQSDASNVGQRIRAQLMAQQRNRAAAARERAANVNANSNVNVNVNGQEQPGQRRTRHSVRLVNVTNSNNSNYNTRSSNSSSNSSNSNSTSLSARRSRN